MKRPPCRTLSAIRAPEKRARRTIWSKEKARVMRGGKAHPKFVRRGKIVTIRLHAPAELNIAKGMYRAQTVDFLHQLRTHSRKLNVQLVLDFSGLDQIFPSGAILLIAELERALASKRSIIRARRSRAPLVEEVLQQIGIYEKLAISCDRKPESESVIHWRVATGTLAEGEAGGTILSDYEGRLAEGLTKGLYDGVVEAMTNTVHHAYADEVSGGRDLRHLIGKRWWILSQERDEMLTVVICDLGVGIPRSLPRSKTFGSGTVREFWRNSGLDKSDGSAIAVAIRLGRTRTELKQRGKGLADIVEAVNLSKEGGVLISSNRGIFSSSKGKEHVHNHTHSIHGTMVHWSVPIDAGTPDNE